MKIEYQRITINSKNINEYENGLLGGRTECPMSFTNQKPAGQNVPEEKVIIYSYDFAPDIDIKVWAPLYKLACQINATQDKLLAHELQHVHNNRFIHPFALSNGNPFAFIALVSLDEISACVAGELYDLRARSKTVNKPNLMSGLGAGKVGTALNRAIDSFAEDNLAFYLDYGVDKYKNIIDGLTKKHANTALLLELLEMRNYILDQNPDIIRMASYTPQFMNAIDHYFTFDGESIADRASRSALVKASKKFGRLEPHIFAAARKCIGR